MRACPLQFVLVGMADPQLEDQGQQDCRRRLLSRRVSTGVEACRLRSNGPQQVTCRRTDIEAKILNWIFKIQE